MKLLFVNCCISQRGENSRTYALCRAFLDAYKNTHPDDEIYEEDIRNMDIPCFDLPMLNRRDKLLEEGRFDDPAYSLARRFAQADKILVGAPLWDLMFPAKLRAYIEHISANGICYHYDEKGCHGDCTCTHLAYLTSGGDFEQKICLPAVCWQQLSRMFGIEKFDYVFAGGLDISPELLKSQMEIALRKAEELGKEF